MPDRIEILRKPGSITRPQSLSVVASKTAPAFGEADIRAGRLNKAFDQTAVNGGLEPRVTDAAQGAKGC
jgi:hypothetical protein